MKKTHLWVLINGHLYPFITELRSKAPAKETYLDEKRPIWKQKREAYIDKKMTHFHT
jgi:hypothetical protein